MTKYGEVEKVSLRSQRGRLASVFFGFVFFIATCAVEGAVITRSVELDLQQLAGASGGPTSSIEFDIDFDDVTLRPNGVDTLVLDILFVDSAIAVSSSRGIFPSFNILFTGTGPDFVLPFLCCTTPTLLGTSGNVQSDSLVLFEPGGLYLLEGDGAPPSFQSEADFLYRGLRVEGTYPGVPDSSEVTGLTFRQGFFNPVGLPGEASLSVVPIPGAAWLFLTGLGVLGYTARKKRTGC